MVDRYIEQAKESLATPFSRGTLYPKLAAMTVPQLANWYFQESQRRDLRRAAALIRSTARGRARAL